MGATDGATAAGGRLMLTILSEARKTQRGEQQATVVGGHRWESALDVAR